jgi:uncharacterized protein YacL
MRHVNDKNIIIGFQFISDILICIGWPTIHKVCIELLPTRYLAFEQLAISFFLILFCSLWKKDTFREKSINIFYYLSLFELISGMVLAFLMSIWFNVWVYAIGSLIYTSAISVLLSRIIIAFKAALFKEKDREDFDNDYQLTSSISSLIGCGLALIYPPSLTISLILWGIACLNNLGWVIVYKRNKIKLNLI